MNFPLILSQRTVLEDFSKLHNDTNESGLMCFSGGKINDQSTNGVPLGLIDIQKSFYFCKKKKNLMGSLYKHTLELLLPNFGCLV